MYAKNKVRVLFLDDRTKRIDGALKKYAGADLTIVCNVKECLRQMAWHDFDIISLDHDLDGDDFCLNSPSGMDVIAYIEEFGWPEERTEPEFIVHSSNTFASNKMASRLDDLGFAVRKEAFGWKEYQKGVVAGAFDVFHPGYVRLLEDAKKKCFYLTVLMHAKEGTVFDVVDRLKVLSAIKYIDHVDIYYSEEELTERLESGNYDVRFVGSDHKDSSSRPDLEIETIYHDRNHDWSATKYKKMIADANSETSVIENNRL